MSNLFLLILAIGTFLLSTTLVRAFCAYAIARGIVDIPNARSSHIVETPRGGGLIFVLLWCIALLMGFGFDLISTETVYLFLPGTLLVSWLGYLDDRKGLSARTRFFAQAIAAGLSLWVLGGVHSLHLWNYSAPWVCGLGWGIFLSLVGIVWSTNLYNFMDGTDGIAAVEALFVFGLGGLLFWLNHESIMALLAWILSAAVGGFLVWNWPKPKASIFMGDVGSYCLGFLVALFAIIGEVKYQIPLILWLILYGFFWFDATVTLLRRVFLKENVLSGHREHAYQRLHRAGFSHKQVLLCVMVLNTLLGGITFWAYFNPEFLWVALIATLTILISFYLVVERIKPMTRISS